MIEKERKLYERRCMRFIERLQRLFYQAPMPLEATYCNFGTPVSFAERRKGDYRPIGVGDGWGRNWEVAWFNLRGTVPVEWRGEQVAARINLGGEGCIFDPEGLPLQSLSVHSYFQPEFSRERYIITPSAKGGEEVELWIEASATQIYGLEMPRDPRAGDPKGFGHYEPRIRELSLAIFREDYWQLYLDFSLLDNQMRALPEADVRRARILHALMEAVDVFQENSAACAVARHTLAPLLAERSSASDLGTVAVGHAHLDTAWLWPLEETVRKCARTFATQLDLLERYPEYIFGASQAQLYDYTKIHYPALFQKIRQQVAAGRWEIQGGMWVEADCNIIGGESMVRQLLHGIRYFETEFGVRVRNLWLPDVFGYSAAMPQILNQCGLDYMVTQKISWNQFNKFPHHSFIWEGIDGSEVLVHFPPEDTYNAEMKPAGLRYARENFSEKGFLGEFLTLFGIGNGGSGPTGEMIESARRQRDLEGSPRVRFAPAQTLLDQLGGERHRLKRWVGELYLEMHRGTLTTQAFIKKANRRMELKLRELEFLYAALPLAHYPAAELDRIWKTVLLQQFHDIIPGSSIHLVYAECRETYGLLQAQTTRLQQSVSDRLTQEAPDHLCLINTLSCHYNRPVELPEGWRGYELRDEQGKALPVQLWEGRQAVLAEMAPLSARTLRRGKPLQPETGAAAGEMLLENDLIRYEFAADGTLARIFDREAQREVLAAGGSGNVLNLYEDYPVDWDAWDIDIYYEQQLCQQARLQSWERVASGPLLQILRLSYRIGGGSVIVQEARLAANSKRLEFHTRVDWRERHKMLRAEFRVNVHSDNAAFEIQYGFVRRPTHRNTSWEMARFESAGQRYVDLSQKDYGLALLNDCKYGHRVHGNLLDLNLLRAPTMPDPEADRGEHEFIYALLPHLGPLEQSEVPAEAAQLNQTPLALPDRDGAEIVFPCRLDNETVVLEVLKKAEAEDCLIARLYEPRGMPAAVNLIFAKPPAAVFETDMLERQDAALPLDGRQVALRFQAFEIKTVKFVVGSK